MRPRRFSAFVCTIVLAFATGAPGRAADVGAGCGSGPAGYSRTADCRLVFRGLPIYVFADVTAPGTASVHVWATIEEAEGYIGDAAPIVVDCTAQGSGYAKCDKGIPDETTQVDHYALQQFHLRCHVASNGTGAYRCVSASGR